MAKPSKPAPAAAAPDETRITARLPTLDVEIVRRQTANAEMVTIQLRAAPSFEAMGDFLSANPLMFGWAQPAIAWGQIIETAWSPWLKLFEASVPQLPLLGYRPGKKD